MGSSTQALLVLTTAPDLEAGRVLARELLDRRLVACASLVPGLESHYRWEGELQCSAEVQLLLKTAPERLAALEAALAELHPYDLPELLALPVEGGGAAYLAWVASEVDAEGRSA
jgi:periplasmic divalent cation tolerance protein